MPTTRLTQSGAIELPADLRQRLGLLEGDEVVLEERDGGLLLRPAIPYEIYTPERIAEFLLNNSVTKENYDDMCEEVRQLGFDPAKVPNTDPDMREKLPTTEEFTTRMDALARRTLDRERERLRATA